MADLKDRQGGGCTAQPTQFLVNTATSHLGVATAPNRIAARIHNLGAAPIYLGYGQVATSTTGFPIVPSSALVERDFLGAINVAAASGATSIVAVNEVRF